jgi:hypothetical protein
MKKRDKTRNDYQPGNETNKRCLQRDCEFSALGRYQRKSRIFVECNWWTLDYNTSVFGPESERESLVGTVDVLRPVLRGS